MNLKQPDFERLREDMIYALLLAEALGHGSSFTLHHLAETIGFSTQTSTYNLQPSGRGICCRGDRLVYP